MKKFKYRFSIGAICIMLAMSLVGCGGGDSSDNSKEKSKTIKEGETYTIEDYAEIKLFKIETTPTITGSTADSFISYDADSDNTYVDVVIDCKNLTGESINSDDFLSLQGTNKDGASYTCSTFIVESGSNLDEYVDIKPKSNTRLHCALEVDKGEKELDLKFDINGEELTASYKLNDEIATKESLSIDTPIVGEGFAELTLKNVCYDDVVYPSNTSDYYYYQEAENPDNTLLVMEFSLTNLQSSQKDIDSFLGVKAKYEGKYTYTGYPALETDNGTDISTFESISPNMPGRLFYIIEVPKSSVGKDVEITLSFNKNEYVYNFK